MVKGFERRPVGTYPRAPRAGVREPPGRNPRGKIAPPVAFELQRVIGEFFAKPRIFVGRVGP